MCVERLTQAVRKFQDSTGEDALLVVLHDDEGQIIGLHRVGYEVGAGLLVDGRPAGYEFYRQVHDFHALQEPPAVVH